jgi:maleamate amidohydrolase
LLLVDLMRAYFTRGSPLDLGSEAVVEAAAELLAAARGNGVPVVHTAVHYRAGAPDGGLFVRKVGALRLLADGAPGNLRELMPAVAPLPEETVVIKQYASAFFGTSLAATLTAARVDTVVIAGVSTSGCIRATATDALQCGFRPLVVADACADRTTEFHESNLRDLGAKYADVIDVGEAVAHFTG